MLRLFQRKRNLSKKRRRRLFLFWLIALILVGAALTNLFRLMKDFASSLNTPTGIVLTFGKFEGEKITGIIVANPLVLAVYDPAVPKVDLFELPQNLYLAVPEKGFFQAGKVYNLVEEDGDGAKLLTTSIFSNFLIPVDFYIAPLNKDFDQAKILEIKDKISTPASIFWITKIPNSAKILKTNFTLFDQFKLFWKLRKVRKDKFNYQTVPQENFEELILPNGDKVVKVSEDGITPDFAKVFQDLKVAREASTVGVLNATKISGLGQRVGEICQNLGGQCEVLGDAEERLPTTKILTKPSFLNSPTAKRLVKTFGGKIEKQNQETFQDFIILVGEDLAEKLIF